MEIKTKEKFNIRYKFFIIITILTIITLVSGTSYAILKGSVTSEKEHIVKAGNVTLELTEYYDEINKDIILLENEDGLLQDVVYEFNIKNIGVVGAKYDVKLVNESTGTSALSSKYIQIGLEVNGLEIGPMNLEEVNNVINSDMIQVNEIVSYKMRLWLDKSKKDEINNITGKTALLKLKIEAEQRGNSLDKSGANAPVLATNMIPVYYDASANAWKKADVDNVREDYKWYDYDEKMWANAVTVYETHRKAYQSAKVGTEISMDAINTMFVWIPRYKYKVWNYNLDGSVATSPQEIEITFEKAVETTGEIKCENTITGETKDNSEVCKVNETECTDSTCNGKTYTHPAFTFGNAEQTGIWISKFEVSMPTNTICHETPTRENCNLENEIINPIIKPNVKARTHTSVGFFDRDIRSMNDNGNMYGFNKTDDPHMIKNTEWGAVAYLSHSKYGTCENETCNKVQMNSSTVNITGCGPQSDGSVDSGEVCNKYETLLGQLASTTGNIYGVYDMSGGRYEWVMANVSYKDGKTMMTGTGTSVSSNSNFSGIVYTTNTTGDFLPYTGFFEYPDRKYYDIYNYNNSAYSYNDSHLGEAAKEIKSTSEGWYGQRLYTPHYQYSWTVRGGSYSNTTSTGIFYQTNGSGGYGTNYTTHAVITK